MFVFISIQCNQQIMAIIRQNSASNVVSQPPENTYHGLEIQMARLGFATSLTWQTFSLNKHSVAQRGPLRPRDRGGGWSRG